MSIEQLQDYGLEQMEDDKVEEFLASQSTGVLGLPSDSAPYLLPMSYAYDGDSTIYFTYLVGDSSRKERLSERGDRAGFLVYNVETMFNWQSVLVTGNIVHTPEEEWSELEDILTNAWQPELFQSASATGRVEVYELDVYEQTGIRHTGLALGFREGIDEAAE
jgi:nitroimidazol reductase NimA-like FMN-containing flavoprotein (pyridoxamine 5'-phosphate oxidase superfamily)